VTAAVLIDPNDVAELEAALERLLSDSEPLKASRSEDLPVQRNLAGIGVRARPWRSIAHWFRHTSLRSRCRG